MAWHQKAGVGVHDTCKQIMERHYPALIEAGITIDVYFAYAPKKKGTGEPTGPAVTLHGKPAAAKIVKNSQLLRAGGNADVRIIVDGDNWQNWSDRRQLALLDHEIHHIQVVKDKDGNIVLDDSKRPQVTFKQHDLDLGIFFPIMKRYGEDAIDTKVLKDGITLIQTEFEFADETPDQWFKQG